MNVSKLLILPLLLLVACESSPDKEIRIAGVDKGGNIVAETCRPEVSLEHDASGQLTSCSTKMVECVVWRPNVKRSLSAVLKTKIGQNVILKDRIGSWHYDTYAIAGKGDDPCAKHKAPSDNSLLLWDGSTYHWNEAP